MDNFRILIIKVVQINNYLVFKSVQKDFSNFKLTSILFRRRNYFVGKQLEQDTVVLDRFELEAGFVAFDCLHRQNW